MSRIASCGTMREPCSRVSDMVHASPRGSQCRLNSPEVEGHQSLNAAAPEGQSVASRRLQSARDLRVWRNRTESVHSRSTLTQALLALSHCNST
jgi:hypothetical protein